MRATLGRAKLLKVRCDAEDASACASATTVAGAATALAAGATTAAEPSATSQGLASGVEDRAFCDAAHAHNHGAAGLARPSASWSRWRPLLTA